MIPSSLIIEVLVAMSIAAILWVIWREGRRGDLTRERGWKAIVVGFLCVFAGALVDISDHFPELNSFVILGRTPQQAFLEKVIGFLGGFILIAIGFLRWLPQFEARKEAEEALRIAHEELEQRVAQRTSELSASTHQLQLEIEERRQTEEKLKLSKDAAEEASRAKSQFLANMSHELRTPLNSVIGFANILRKKKQDSLTEQEGRYLERIRSNGEHLLHLINEILDLERIESGRMEVQLETVDLKMLIEDTLSEMSQPRGSAVSLHADLPQKVKHLRSDPLKIKQVLLNLIGNGLKFTSTGSVTVRLEVDESHQPLRLSVIDTGIGIPRDRLRKIFEAFQQIDAGKSRRFGGTGLGLSISESLCRLLGYDLEVESEEGKGSAFSVIFQEEPETGVLDGTGISLGKTSEEDEDAWRDLAGKRVLVVDDNADARLLLSEYLAGLGCRPLVAASGEEALFLAERENPDLITLDLMMPEMDGWTVLSNLKNDPLLAPIPVVVVSILAEEKKGTVLGAVDALTKPVSRRKLTQVLKRILLEQPSPSRPTNILIVDDEEGQRLVLAEYLRDMGFGVVEAENGRDALALLEHRRVDLALVDLSMPIMDGPTFLQTLRKRPDTSLLPVAVITGKELTHQEVEALKPEVSTILAKGQTLELELRRFIESMATQEEITTNG